MIKLLNHRKRKERERDVQVKNILTSHLKRKKRDFSFDFPPNLDFNPSVGAEMKEKEDGIKRNEREGV